MAYSPFNMGDPRLLYAISICVLFASGKFLVSLYKARRMIIEWKKRGMRMPPHHPLFGHLLVARDILSAFPKDAHPLYFPIQIRRKYPEVGPLFYIDLWPFSDPFLVVASPFAAHQLIQEHPQPKADVVRNFMYPLTKNHDLITMEGQMWKEWRNVYNPGFSAGHLIKLVPEIVKQVSTFCEVLEEHVNADDMFYLEKVTISLTIDVIGIVTLGTDFNAQRSENDFVSAIRNMILWLPSGSELNPFEQFNLLRPFAHWYYTRRMDRYLSTEIDSCYLSHKGLNNNPSSPHQNSKTIIGLAIDKYLEGKQIVESTNTLDPVFKSFATSQMKGLILAGHGTTANTICYVYYMLSTHPSSLKLVREEHAAIFGTNTASAIIEDPHLLNQLPYTLAVIKETLRLFPADASPRKGSTSFFLKDDISGLSYPTQNCMVWSMPQAIHREPLYWPQPDTFLPERWLTAPDDPLHPVKGAWRAFEFGPRNCVGQELSMLEMKIVLVMTLRRFDVRGVFEEWEGVAKKRPGNVNGEKGYQVLDGTNRPRGGFPCRVKAAAVGR